MSITDHLPPAPQGLKWDTYITEGHSEPRLVVRLDPDYLTPIPIPGSYYRGYVSAPTLDEDGVRKAAEEVLEGYARNLREEARKAEIEEELRARYAHLLTD